jgi:hypothetical protein
MKGNIGNKTVDLVFKHDSIMLLGVATFTVILAPIFAVFMTWKKLSPNNYARRFDPEYIKPTKNVIDLVTGKDKFEYVDAVINVT